MKAKSYLAGAVLALAAVCSAAEVGTAGAVRPAMRSSRPHENRPVAPVRRFLRRFVTAQSRPMPPDRSTGFYVAFARLGPAGERNAVVYLRNGGWCGTGGCTMLVLAAAGRGWKLVSRTTAVRTPIEALPSRSRGWRNLAVYVAGGGVRGHMAELRFNGRGYLLNPTVPPARKINSPRHPRMLIPNTALYRKPCPVFPAGQADKHGVATHAGGSIPLSRPTGFTGGRTAA